MPYEKYKISMRDHNFKRPKTTLKRESESYRKKLILIVLSFSRYISHA